MSIFAWSALLLARGGEQQQSGRARRENITVYRVTPVNLTGVSDRNTGDAAGDIFFTLYIAIAPVYCPANPTDSICNITSSVLGDTQRNIYRKSVVEVDPNYGIYNGCNPNSDGTVDCHSYARGDVCWYNTTCGSAGHTGAIGPFCAEWNSTAGTKAADAAFTKNWSPLCERSSCTCEKELNQSVGNWPCVFCRPVTGPPHKKTKLWDQINSFAQTLHGNWFSTRAAGECEDGQRPGDGACFWKEMEVVKRANATCVRQNLLDAIAKRGAPCYSACPQPTNTSSVCYVECMLSTITPTTTTTTTDLYGNAMVSPVGGGMTRAELLEPFEKSFASEDHAKGGCPNVAL